ncbi:MAG TPA: hypothetical protein VMY88_07425 [Acidimicrobiales bacterium]|nr:hypothetical protein [Acidimicrobiales bacterium]
MRGHHLLGALLIIGGVLPSWTAPGEAAQLNTAGWWWRAQTGTVALPPPPHVPANGLSVGNAPDGPSAVAALRFALDVDEIDPVLTLTTAEEFASGAVGLVACPSGSPWFGIQAGNWDDRPEAKCDAATVIGVTSPDGTGWTFPLSAVYSDGLLDVVILPAPDSDPFEMSFEPPTAASLRTTSASPATGLDSDFDSTGSGAEESFVPPSGAFDGGVAFGAPLVPGVPAFGEPPTAADDPAAAAPRRFVPIAQGRGPAVEDTTDPRPLALVVLLAALVVAAMLGREPLPVPRLLGPMAARREMASAEPEVRGLGRFRRPRRGEAPSLH